VCSITQHILTDARGPVNRPTRLKCSGNRLLALVALACAAALGAGCGPARRPPRVYPSPPPPPVEAPVPGAPPAEEPPAEAPRAAAGGEAIASVARSLQGAPYRNGGSGPEGFDCSGFVQYVFARAGVALPRSVREQFEAGIEVEGRPRAGDLLFFAIDGERVSHVGIATGPDRFVHAPSSTGVVREERLSSSYWSRRYAGARRIITPG